MEKKANFKKLNIKNIFIIYVFVMLILFAMIVINLFDVNYGISLKDNSIEYGQNVTLEFHVDNYLLFVDVNSIIFEYWIEQNNSVVFNETKIDIPDISSFSDHEDKVIIPTHELEKGDYAVWAQLTYSMGEGRKGVGNREAKLLSWELSIV